VESGVDFSDRLAGDVLSKAGRVAWLMKDDGAGSSGKALLASAKRANCLMLPDSECCIAAGKDRRRAERQWTAEEKE